MFPDCSSFKPWVCVSSTHLKTCGNSWSTRELAHHSLSTVLLPWQHQVINVEWDTSGSWLQTKHFLVLSKKFFTIYTIQTIENVGIHGILLLCTFLTHLLNFFSGLLMTWAVLTNPLFNPMKTSHPREKILYKPFLKSFYNLINCLEVPYHQIIINVQNYLCNNLWFFHR